MVSTRKKRQLNKKLLGQLDDFNQDTMIGNDTSGRQENIVVNQDTNNRDFTVGTSNNKIAINESAVNVKTFGRKF